MDQGTQLMESMAVAVLKGDLVAARALADVLQETVGPDGRTILAPIARASYDRRAHAVLSYTGDKPRTADEIRGIETQVIHWLSGYPDVLHLPPGYSLRLYELPYNHGSSASTSSRSSENHSTRHEPFVD